MITDMKNTPVYECKTKKQNPNYGKNNESAHRALSDCLATNDCLCAMADEVSKSFGSTEIFIKTLK